MKMKTIDAPRLQCALTEKELTEHFIKFEGKIPHFYLDGVGLVTIGIGCMIENHTEAMQLKLYRKQDDKLAIRSEIIAEFNTIKSLVYPAKISYYAKNTFLYLPDNHISELFITRLSSFIIGINSKLVKLSEYPKAAQLVLIDMAYNLGLNGLEKKFPKFMLAISQKDYRTAAQECKRRQIQEARNDWTYMTLLSLVK